MPVVERIGSGRPVVMIHGSPGDRGTWELVARRTPPGAASWVVELASHGQQPLHTDGLAGYLADLRTVLDEACAEGGGPVVVAGLSVGGYLALRLARDHADDVRGVVTCAGFARIDAEGAAWRRQIAQALVRGEETAGHLFSQWLDLLVAVGDRAEGVEQTLRRSLGDESAERIATIARASAEIGDPGAEVRSIAAPVVVLHGRGDPLLPVAEAEVVRGVSARARVEILETASHVITLSHPDAVAGAVFASWT